MEPPGRGPGGSRESAAFLTPEGVRLRKLWDEHRATPVPVADTGDPRSELPAARSSVPPSEIGPRSAGILLVPGQLHQGLLHGEQARHV